MPARDPTASAPHILCAGIVVLDEVFRLPRVPEVDTKSDASDYVSVGGGCAANAAIAIARLGGRASFAGPLGGDETGDRILAHLAHEGIDCRGCVRVPDAVSTVSAILVDDRGRRTIATYNDKRLLTTAPADAPALVQHADGILLDNRRPNFVAPVLAAARAFAIPIIVDADKPTTPDDPLLAGASHVIFSADCLRATTGDQDLAAALGHMHRVLGCFVAVTDGSNDVLWIDDGPLQTMPVFKIATVDTLGAGDVFHGAFALALIEGRALPDALRFAAAAAALKSIRFGGSSTAPTRAEVETFLRKN